jgi:adenylosuccinate synthase
MMKPNSMAVLGLQWGDEGKGKVIDYLSEGCDAVARFGGGANAGHTIVVDGQKYILKLLPSGVLHKGKICFIGSGVACDPWVLRTEIEELAEKGITVDGRLFVDFAAHLVLPLHKAADGYQESRRGKGAIDTTKRGIGPSYADRASRVGLRLADLFDEKLLGQKIDHIFAKHEECIKHIGDESLKNKDGLLAELQIDGSDIIGQTGAVRRRAGDATGRRPGHLSLCNIVAYYHRRDFHRSGDSAGLCR